jgi:UDPglucose 6-dehydrogenase
MRKLCEAVNDLPSRTIAVLGIAFKPNTDDTRESQAEKLVEKLSETGCAIRAYDPKAKLSNRHRRNVTQVASCQEATSGADCVIVATDWAEFQQLDWQQVKQWMKGDLVLDARNCLDRNAIEQCGLRYIGVGIG